MLNKSTRTKIYKSVTDLLEKKHLTRVDLLDALIANQGFTPEQLNDCTTGCPRNVFRSQAGTIVSEMMSDGVIVEDGSYLKLASSRQITVRIESCERELLKRISKRAMTKKERFLLIN